MPHANYCVGSTETPGKARALMSDVQSELSLEQQVECMKQQLSEAQKLTALGSLLGTTTHEFNNILMTVINYAKLGLRHHDQESRDKAFRKILDAGEKAAKITSSILGMARNRSGSAEPTDLPELIEGALLLLEREMNKYRISVTRDLDEVPPVMANANQIQQVLLNLLINARQAMPSGGELRIRVRFEAESQIVQLQVRDSGNGISADKLPHIFDPYFTTKSGPDETGKGGTGLGLSACRDIIQAHHGKIRVQSTVGKGTAFTIMLPVAQRNNGSLGRMSA